MMGSNLLCVLFPKNILATNEIFLFGWLIFFSDVLFLLEAIHQLSQNRNCGMTWLNLAVSALSSLVTCSNGLSIFTRLSISVCSRHKNDPSIPFLNDIPCNDCLCSNIFSNTENVEFCLLTASWISLSWGTSHYFWKSFISFAAFTVWLNFGEVQFSHIRICIHRVSSY